MSKRAEERGLEAFPGQFIHDRVVFKIGYEQAEKDTLERAIEWWRPRLCGFLKEGLTEGVLEEFRNAMEEEK